MNRYLVVPAAVMSGLVSLAAFAAPGEYWEITSKTEMPGMPFAMPATTQKVCIPKGEQNNPEKTSGDKSCKMTDVKTVGNKTTWKMRCDHDGEVMTGSGEQTTSPGVYHGKMQFSGKSGGHDVNMTSVFSGKRIGGSCDSEEAVKAMKAQVCDTSHFKNTADWISGGSELILQEGSACADKRKQFCDLVRRDTPKDADAYNALVMHDEHMVAGISVAKECKVNMAATTKSICKQLNGDTYSKLSAHCPAEAKAYREKQRREECEGRSYTAATRAEDIKKCMSGAESSSEEPREAPAATKSGSSPAGDMLDKAKKLKGMFGF